MSHLTKYGKLPIGFDILASDLSEYKSPRQKIIYLEQQGKIIRLKRGLYVVSPSVSTKTLSLELIANHLYGPSYVSMESALRYYGLIPESVHTVTSMTLKLTKTYDTPVGRFEYIHSSSDYYSIGLRQIVDDESSFLIASPEKALCDYIAYTPKLRLRFIKSMQIFLEEDLRFDMDEFYKMDTSIFESCAAVSKKGKDISNLVKLLK